MIKLRLNEILKEREMRQKDLAKASGLRESSISDMVRGIRSTVNLEQLEKVMDCLEITDYNEIFEKVEEKVNV
ncbi:helix-turn-helix transcriptional regulator [Bacillus sp. SIMBA_074]|jgi:DNA-binding Xre family transcriptional regulator|uniref:Transcriptional regulator n=2 Tax=Bacillaceae TaxID=186817 RepID=A0A3Q9QZP3_9BACI|nr:MULTISPECIES: helix-turn-helix transcriptional regulator [Bacillaceae]AZU62576.1 transcriptional regulator [Neobacillus mesonae]MBD8590389.1 helix-turn-helix transcriptional regulator [Peribacillus simplex]MCU5656400.1 helix-turn-helix transcriptional regulator [Bacillus mycoides]MED2793067.1 helix-turn-helix transcriptional regulator [Bacillus wiedmannii]PLT29822.1 XRE family transcriptional regulator [Peribacillus deserti]